MSDDDWTKDLGTRIGKSLRRAAPDAWRQGAKDAADKYAAWVKSEPLGMPKAVRDPAVSLERRYVAMADPHAKQDAELEVLRLQQEAARKQIEEQSAPRDGGEIDQPEVRQPVQMNREFSNDRDREAYIDLIRQAQKNVKK